MFGEELVVGWRADFFGDEILACKTKPDRRIPLILFATQPLPLTIHASQNRALVTHNPEKGDAETR